jgi:hypothetical protein
VTQRQKCEPHLPLIISFHLLPPPPSSWKFTKSSATGPLPLLFLLAGGGGFLTSKRLYLFYVAVTKIPENNLKQVY